MRFSCDAVYPTLAASDVKAACDWYVDTLGFSLRFLYGDPPTHWAVLLDKACVHFWEGPAQLGANWLYFDVTDLDAMYDRARQGGVSITGAPRRYEWGMREFNAVDLNGYNLRFGEFAPARSDYPRPETSA